MTFRELFEKVDTTKSYVGINGAMSGLAEQLKELYIGKYNVRFYTYYGEREIQFNVLLETYEQARENGHEHFPKMFVLNSFINAHTKTNGNTGYYPYRTCYTIKDVFLMYNTDVIDEDIDEFITRSARERGEAVLMAEIHKKAVIYKNEELINEAVNVLLNVNKQGKIVFDEIGNRLKTHGCDMTLWW